MFSVKLVHVSRRITKTSWIPKVGKNILLLSSDPDAMEKETDKIENNGMNEHSSSEASTSRSKRTPKSDSKRSVTKTPMKAKDKILKDMKKPRVVLLYNQYKAGVDLTDRHTGEYTCQRKTRRWTLALMENCVDLCVHNAYILFTSANPSWQKGCPSRKRKFLEWLAKDLAIEHVRKRTDTIGHDKELRKNIKTFIENYEGLYGECSKPTAKCGVCGQQGEMASCSKCRITTCNVHTKLKQVYKCADCKNGTPSKISKTSGKKRCQLCHRSKDRKTSVYCCVCTKYVCVLHEHEEQTMKFCSNCL